MGFFGNLLNKFGSSESTREMLKKNYVRYRKKAERRNSSPYDAHVDAVSRLLVGRCSSPLNPYNVNQAKMMSEIYPFTLEGPDDSVPLLIEYILYLENDPAVNKNILHEEINRLLEDFLAKESKTENDLFSEHLEIISSSIGLDIPWTRFIYTGIMTKILDPDERDSNSSDTQKPEDKTVKQKPKKPNDQQNGNYNPHFAITDSKPITYEMLKMYMNYGSLSLLEEKGTEEEKKIMGYKEFKAIHDLMPYINLLNDNLASRAYEVKIIEKIIERTKGEKAIRYISQKAWKYYRENK